LTRSREQAVAGQIESIAALLSRGVYPNTNDVPKKLRGKPASRADLKRMILDQGVNPHIVNAADSLSLNDGRLGPYGRVQARKAGVHAKRWPWNDRAGSPMSGGAG
jgi:hypothetical protein